MKNDAFSKCHPAVNFLFFVGAMGCGVAFWHPAYLIAGAAASTAYYLLLQGRKGLPMLRGLLALFALLTVINPLFNLRGDHVWFRIFGRPYTLEALLYGGAVAAMFVIMTLWFGCYHKVMTGDKFTALFGNLIPSVSLVLVMVFRMVPDFIRKTAQISGARKSIGKGGARNASKKEKLADGLVVMGTLTAWALEGSVTTADSIRARGYGSAKRSSFMIYRMSSADWVLLAVMAALLASVITAASLGQTAAVYTPGVSVAPVSWGILPYGAYLLIPSAFHIKEAIQWHISRSKI